ncbi:MAG: START-like domain-containing protein [Marinilabiliaceae bacterium]|nr:START-like domain-containing protein [Marinilabiliaceae bacterium]
MSEQKKTIEIEYFINTSPAVLYNSLSTPKGLAEWFADSVTAEGFEYTFIWSKSEQKAVQTICNEDQLVRFQWLDDYEDNSWFEFQIKIDEITGDLSLIVVDNVDFEDEIDAIEQWNKQIEILKRSLGSL